MDYVPLHKTRMGEKFFAKSLPDLIRAIERLAAALEKLTPPESFEPKPKDGD